MYRCLKKQSLKRTIGCSFTKKHIQMLTVGYCSVSLLCSCYHSGQNIFHYLALPPIASLTFLICNVTSLFTFNDQLHFSLAV